MTKAKRHKSSESLVQPAPVGWGPVARQLGPGLIIAASIVGSGELIVTTKLGGDVGFVLLWFIVLGCLIKVLVQIEFGRYAIAHGQTTLQALDSVPGPRLRIGWLVYVWLAMYISTVFQVAGMVGSIGDIFRFGGAAWSSRTGALLVALSCSLLLVVGRYRLVERASAAMVALFTLFTLLAVGALHWTEYAVSSEEILAGFALRLPEKFTTAFAAFGIIGVGASELIYYPYWCLEKGYGRAVGPNDGSAAWGERARGWMRVLRADAWVSMVIYTGATIAFYVLGAAVLHGKSVAVTNDKLIPSLSHMYLESFGPAGLWIFLIGAFVVLYSTVFISTASNARLLADVTVLSRLIRDRNGPEYDRLVRIGCALLPLLYLSVYLCVRKPLTLVFIGAIGQAMMLPPLCLVALYFHHARMVSALRTGWLWTVLLWISAVLMTGTGIYQLYLTLR
jgi:Mn2+/Fe2+ NRAMP family transporter